jgi:hypothetical protein
VEVKGVEEAPVRSQCLTGSPHPVRISGKHGCDIADSSHKSAVMSVGNGWGRSREMGSGTSRS